MEAIIGSVTVFLRILDGRTPHQCGCGFIFYCTPELGIARGYSFFPERYCPGCGRYLPLNPPTPASAQEYAASRDI